VVEIIQTNHLTKYYGKNRGIEDVTFSVQHGEIFGFLGPNGAGKTTTIRTLLGLLKPTRGSASIFGLSVGEEFPEIKQDIGYIPGDMNLYPYLTGRQFLSYFSKLRGHNTFLLKDLVKIFNVPLDQKIRSYSHGMKQQLGIIQAFMHDPEVVIMDEPTSGLDPLLQQKFYDFLSEQKKKGKTLFLSSHILSEVDKICDRVGIIRNGTMTAVEKVDVLKQKKGKLLRVKIKEKPESFAGPRDMKVVNGWIQFIVNTSEIDRWLKKLGLYTVLDVEVHEFSLEEIFMHYYEGKP
jgi:ABC-2 type transport system ATP-binding protein